MSYLISALSCVIVGTVLGSKMEHDVRVGNSVAAAFDVIAILAFCYLLW